MATKALKSKSAKRTGVIPTVSLRRPATETLVPSTALYRVFTQPPKTVDRTLAFNPHSNGRASPVRDKAGNVDPAMYVSVGTQEGAVLEVLYHEVLKKYRRGSVLLASTLNRLLIVQLVVKKPLVLASMPALEDMGFIMPSFDLPRKGSYVDTQADAQRVYIKYAKCSGMFWLSARGPAVAAVLYQSRTPKGALAAVGKAEPVRDHPVWDYVREVLAFHGIRLVEK